MNYAEATLSGGTINSLGGIRLASQEYSKGVLNINGPISIITGGDVTVGRNALGEAVMNMSAGSLKVGRSASDSLGRESEGIANPARSVRMEIGNRGPGRLNMSGGSITITNDIRVGADGLANGSEIYMTGGSITTPSFTIRRSIENLAGEDLGAAIIVDGPTASFTQSGNSNIIAEHGKGTFEVRQGTALLGGGGFDTNVGLNADSQSTLKLSGGKLILAGKLAKLSTLAPAPVIELTGGTLEFNTPTAAAQTWQPNLTNTGSKLVLKPNALQQVVVGGDNDHLSNFSMSGGSWDIEIGAHTVLGADWFNANRGTASLTGGTLNIDIMPGFTPNNDEVFRILRGAQGVTLNAANISITGDNAANWVLQAVSIAGTPGFPNDAEIQLKYLANVTLPGDHNKNGIVDAADYVAWRKIPSMFDGSPTGYTNWKTNFGRTSPGGGGSGVVPEPASIILLGLFASVSLGSRRARHIGR
jgi:hypothetical protein